MDVELVASSDRSQLVGRPTLYILIDVYSRLIMAFSIGFNTNSFLGLSTMLANLAEDKTLLCQKYGIAVSGEEWPSGYMPGIIRADRGSDMIGHDFKQVLQRTGITGQWVPGGTGSLKPNVEQWFHQMHEAQNSALNNHGRITKSYNSNHKKTASLTLQEYTEIILNFIADYNKKYMDSYPYTIDMREKDVDPVPWKLWKYGVSCYGNPKPIVDKDHFYFNLLPEAKRARITRKGIEFKGLIYDASNDIRFSAEMYKAGTRRVPVEGVRYDPRDIDRLYYLNENNELKTVPLSSAAGSEDKKGLTFAEWEEFRQFKKKKDEKGAAENQLLKSKRAVRVKDQVAEAAKKSSPEKKSGNIKKERNKEKQDDNRSQKFYDKTSLSSSGQAAEPAGQQNDPQLSSPPRDYNEEYFDALLSGD